MNKKLIVCLLVCFLFPLFGDNSSDIELNISVETDNSSQTKSDTTSDPQEKRIRDNNKDATADVKKKTNGSEFQWSWSERWYYSGNQDAPDDLELLYRFNFHYSRLWKFYQLKVRTASTFTVDFYPLYLSTLSGNISFNELILRSLTQKFSLGTDHRFRFRGVMDLNFGLSAALNTPFDNYPFLSLEPGINLSGSYYFGLDWYQDLSVNADIYPDDSRIVWFPYSYTSISFEFFRYYGPRDLRITLFTENIFSPELSVPDDYFLFNNLFKSGIFFLFYGVSPSLGFVYQTEWFYLDGFHYNCPGFFTGISWSYQQLYISVEYQGSWDLISSQWQNRVDASIRLRWNKVF